MAVDINAITPLVLDPELVRTLFDVNQTGNQPLADVAEASARWNYTTNAGTGVALTYAFSAAAPPYDPGNVDSGTYAALSAGEQANCEAAMAAWADCVDVSFTKVANPDNADIVFRKVDLTLPPSIKGFAFFPPLGGEGAQNGDVFLDLTGADIRSVVVHELGHALGLAHPFEGGTRPTPADFGYDQGQLLSIMDYSTPPRDLLLTISPGGNGYSAGSISDPAVPMPVDILAAQMLYGANMSTRAGNTVYSYTVDPVTDGVLYQTVWDAGGNDTIDVSNQSGPSMISLVPGSFSTVGLFDPLDGLSGPARTSAEAIVDRCYDGSNALAIAFDCIIENARGGSAADVLIGNTAGNKLYGNGGNDTIDGAGGNDLLKGAAGRDRLVGGAGKDSLDGGGGIDTLIGGGGNDVFFVTAGDVVRELKGGGTDTVRSGVNFVLANNVENLVLTGGKDVRGTGNNQANTLIGNNGDNKLVGNGGADVLKGNGGNDVLRGGTGSDKLTGGGGADSFRFETKLGANNMDRVTDFKPGTDTVVLDHTVSAALSPGALDASQFHSGAGIVTASDANDRILFNTSTGALFYDADGTGGGSSPVQFALLAGAAAATVSAGDFLVVT